MLPISSTVSTSCLWRDCRPATGTADACSVAFRSQHVESERQIRPGAVRLHVEGLDRSGVAKDHHRPVELLRTCSFLVSAEVVAEFHVMSVLAQAFEGLFVRIARKRRFHRLEL